MILKKQMNLKPKKKKKEPILEKKDSLSIL